MERTWCIFTTITRLLIWYASLYALLCKDVHAMHNNTQVMSYVHGPRSRFKNKAFGCRNPSVGRLTMFHQLNNVRCGFFFIQGGLYICAIERQQIEKTKSQKPLGQWLQGHLKSWGGGLNACSVFGGTYWRVHLQAEKNNHLRWTNKPRALKK